MCKFIHHHQRQSLSHVTEDTVVFACLPFHYVVIWTHSCRHQWRQSLLPVICCALCMCRLAKDPFPGVASGFIRSQWAVWLWLLSHSDITRNAWRGLSHVETGWLHAWTDHTNVPRWWTGAQKPWPHIQWSRSVSSAHAGHGQSTFAAGRHNEAFWQVWNWVLKLYKILCHLLFNILYNIVGVLQLQNWSIADCCCSYSTSLPGWDLVKVRLIITLKAHTHAHVLLCSLYQCDGISQFCFRSLTLFAWTSGSSCHVSEFCCTIAVRRTQPRWIWWRNWLVTENLKECLSYKLAYNVDLATADLKCPSVRVSVRPSAKSFFDFNEIWCVGRGRWVMHDRMQYDLVQGQGHEPLKVGNPAIFNSYLLCHLQSKLGHNI